MPWDEEAFQARIMKRAKARGIKSARELMQEAGVSPNTFDKVPGASGRTYNIIESIANAVDWTVAEAIGQGWSESLLKLAIDVAFKAVGTRDEKELSAAIVSSYDVFSAMVADGLTIDESARATQEASLRQRKGR
jgi:hypothetical protein